MDKMILNGTSCRWIFAQGACKDRLYISPGTHALKHISVQPTTRNKSDIEFCAGEPAGYLELINSTESITASSVVYNK